MLSVIVPVYNTEEYVRQCIECILNQDFEDIELILVNDGSTDTSGEICDEYMEMDHRVYVYHIPNGGLFNARKFGVMQSRGEYITFVDADDFIEEKSYSLAESEMKKGVDVICFGIYRYHSDDWITQDYDRYEEGIYDRENIKRHLFPNMIHDFTENTAALCPSLCVKVIKRELFLDFYADSKEMSIFFGEDALLTYSIVSKATCLCIKHGAYYYHRQRARGVVSPFLLKQSFYDMLYVFYTNFRKSLPEDIFAQQIEAYYVKFIDMRKKLLPYPETQSYLFPFGKVRQHSKVIIYAAGVVGKAYVEQIRRTGYCQIVAWVDKNYDSCGDKEVKSVEMLRSSLEYDCIIVAIESEKIKKEVIDMLCKKYGIKKEQVII